MVYRNYEEDMEKAGRKSCLFSFVQSDFKERRFL